MCCSEVMQEPSQDDHQTKIVLCKIIFCLNALTLQGASCAYMASLTVFCFDLEI